MKSKLVLLSVCCLLSAPAFGQDYPHVSAYRCPDDSLVAQFELPGIGVAPVVWNPRDNSLFVCGYFWLWVVDCAADTVMDEELGEFNWAPYALDTIDDKLYCPGRIVPAQEVTVYDCSAESVTASIPVQDVIWAMVWSAAANKLYVSFGRYHEYIEVIDCRTDSFIRFINPVGHSAYSLCPDDAAGKLYYGRDSAIGAIDVNSDSVVSRVYLPGGPDWLLLNPVSQRLYVQDGSRGIYVLDCYTDSIVDSFPHRFGSPGGIDPARNRMYLFMDTTLCAVDLSTGLIVDTLTTASVNSMTLDVFDNKVYAFWADDFNLTDSVLVIDADSGRTLRVLRGPDLALRGVVWNPLMNRIYVGGDNWVGAVASKQAPVGTRGPRLPTIVRRLPPGAVAFDAMGRRVVNPRPGVYFVRSEPSAVSRQPSAVIVRKVILQR
jgi:hypothetical protein